MKEKERLMWVIFFIILMASLIATNILLSFYGGLVALKENEITICKETVSKIGADTKKIQEKFNLLLNKCGGEDRLIEKCNEK